MFTFDNQTKKSLITTVGAIGLFLTIEASKVGELIRANLLFAGLVSLGIIIWGLKVR